MQLQLLTGIKTPSTMKVQLFRINYTVSRLCNELQRTVLGVNESQCPHELGTAKPQPLSIVADELLVIWGFLQMPARQIVALVQRSSNRGSTAQHGMRQHFMQAMHQATLHIFFMQALSSSYLSSSLKRSLRSGQCLPILAIKYTGKI